MCLRIFIGILGLFQCEERAAYFNAAYAMLDHEYVK